MSALLAEGRVLQHPFVTGELACGHLHERTRLLANLGRLPRAPLVPPEGVLVLVETSRLFGRGLAWVDANLLASALAARVKLWTLDRALERAALRLGILE